MSSAEHKGTRIPKVIHYCWFGPGKMPQKAIQCMNSWKKYLPSYRWQLWNENSFDVNSVSYVKEAYEARKYAFVTDYIRLWALFRFGGIYMDTDVEVLKPLDDLLDLPAFSGFESDTDIPTGIMASEPEGKWAKEQLEYYNNRHFILSDGRFDMTSNAQTISRIMSENGFILQNGYRIYKDCMHIFPKDYFCPKSRTGIITLTSNTYCIHHFTGSWHPLRLRIKRYIFHTLIGPQLNDKLVRMKRKVKKFIHE